jgi:hypothetical protein
MTDLQKRGCGSLGLTLEPPLPAALRRYGDRLDGAAATQERMVLTGRKDDLALREDWGTSEID